MRKGVGCGVGVGGVGGKGEGGGTSRWRLPPHLWEGGMGGGGKGVGCGVGVGGGGFDPASGVADRKTEGRRMGEKETEEE